MIVDFHESASEELFTILESYAAENRRVAADFVEEVSRAVSLLADNPYLAQTVSNRYRDVLRRFPFSLVYSIDSIREILWIEAVVDQRANPERWRDKLRESAAVYLAA